MAKSKYYVVWEGVNTGIFETWDDCLLQIKGYPNAKYKSFPSLAAAKEAIKGNYEDFTSKTVNLELQLSGLEENQPKPIMPSLSVDAACNTITGDMEYRGVDTETGVEFFRKGPFKDGTNNIGEFLAIVHGLAMLKQRNSVIPVYTDSKTAICWIRQKRANTKLSPTSQNSLLFELIDRAEKWLKTNKWDNPLFKWETQHWGEIPADFGRK